MYGTTSHKADGPAIQTCSDVRGDYSGTGLRCDEHPFASAEERGTDGLRYSGRLIDRPEK
ncbi:NucA/NucB deoxyribonuclease domain-containing protein [Streptomyces spongiicola]|uniref:NucA/NucB deoxyribonuclease domain-containing protein n=1 Tax=Streptomyces spongiicola TaxID=1690221 RepID=UPI0035A5E80D